MNESSNSGPRRRPIGAALVIEDDAMLGEAVRDYLQDEGYVTHLVPTLTDARRQLVRNAIDCVVLDLTLTAEFGGDLLEELASSPSAPVVVVMSAFALAPIVAQRYGVILLRKPFDLSALGDALIRARNEDLRPRRSA